MSDRPVVPAGEQLPRWLAMLEEEAHSDPTAPSSSGVPIAFMLGWGTISTIALGSGALLGYRSFGDTVAYEALDKLDKPTPASEAQASRLAVRAFGWGTALAFGTAAAAVFLARNVLGVRTAEDVQTSARSVLEPFDRWLHRQGDLLQSIPAASNAALDGLCDSIAQRWQSSAIGIAFRKRVERGGEAEAEPLSSHAAQPTDTERPISQEPR